ncbi:MAG: hypothetical protein VXV76_01005 [Candidatus Thermoplasmatota archaeon]|nr:hypothetical protein [Candidatus Thermoplasmatota archaeon]MEC8313023.1 hypothetical protein [Candidatus Thermoplasmatota archaeon]
MAIDKNRMKTSLFLALLMILTPFATASTVTTFSDGSSEVVIEFKDGYSLENNSDGGFFLGSGETITSATVNISSSPMKHHSSVGYSGIVSKNWDNSTNNGDTSFDDASKFIFNKNTVQNTVQFTSESFLTDFEYDDGDFDNSTTNIDDNGNQIAWNYDAILNRELNQGPDECASGDMCWGTNIFDEDYTDDLGGLQSPGLNQIEFRMKSPVIMLDNNLNDTFLRFSSWHQLETKFNSVGDYYYDDCAYVEIEYTPTGAFGGEQIFEPLMINFPQTTGVGPALGLYAKDDDSASRDRISPECYGLEDNFFGLAGTSTNPQNQDGWATIAANLGPYLGNYIKLNFVLWHADAGGSVATQIPTPGWFIDDVTIGEKYAVDGSMIINNIQPPQDYDEKSPNGYGLLFTDSFEPGDSKLSYTIRDTYTNQIVLDKYGNSLENLNGPVLELWDIDVFNYPIINLQVNFESGSEQISTPVFYGYSFGTELGFTFNDLDRHRRMSVTDGVLDYVHDKGVDLFINSSSFISTNDGEFSRPIYAMNVTGIKTCQPIMEVNSPTNRTPQQVIADTWIELPKPVFEFDLKIGLYADCQITDVWVKLEFGHHANGISIDYGQDQVNEWEFIDPGYGSFGFQTKFYSGEFNGISQGSDSDKLSLDPITGTAVGGFFLLPKGATIDYFDMMFVNNGIYNVNNSNEGFKLSLIVGAESNMFSITDNEQEFHLYESVINPQKPMQILQSFINNPSVPVIKTDSSGIEWVRVGFHINQTETVNGGSVDIQGLKVIYNTEQIIGQDGEFANYLRELVAISNQDTTQSTASQIYIPVETKSLNGGKITLKNLSVSSQSGYDSTLQWNSASDGLYASGEIYHITTTHSVDSSTGSSLAGAKISFRSTSNSFSLGYDLISGWYDEGDAQEYVIFHPSSSASPLNGGQQIEWKFTVNPNWDDQEKVIILSETIADNGVVGMLSGVSIAPTTGNAVENDIRINDFKLFNSAGTEQDLIEAYSSQSINLRGNLTFESVSTAPDPASYFLVVEERGIEIDGEFTNVTWTEIANRSGTIGGYFDWNVNLGLFASGLETYRFRATGYDGGDTLCPPVEYNPDSDCAIQFNMSIDILDPNLISFELYKRNSGEGDINSDDNWRSVYDDSWATPKLQQDFRLEIGDVPTPPETAVLHVWVEYDHDSNSNGFAESSEYIQVATTSNGAAPNATFIGTYNDFANSGLKGKVSVWVESYDLAGNPVDGGGPGFDNDYVTYVSMDLEYPTINSLNIENSNGVKMLSSIPTNAPDGVGIWNQTMFAGNEYNIVIDAEDGNGWKDVEFIEVVLAPQETNYDSTIIYYPRNQTALTNSDLFNIAVDSSGDSRATIRTLDGNVLIDPFEPEFIINIPITFEWGLPLSGQYTPSFQIKDLDNTPVFSESSYRQTWTYQNDMRLDFRSDLEGQRMVSPTLTDQDIPISDNLYHEIGRETFLGSVTGGDVVMFSGQYSFTSGMLENVFITPEVELTMEINRKEVLRDTEKDYDPVDGEITTHTFTGGKFDIPIKMPSYQNEFEYEFKLINLPVGAEDLTTAYCFGSVINGCGKFVIKVDDEAPKLVFGSWAASRGETATNGLEPELYDSMPTSTYHCVDVSTQIEERGSLAEDATTLNWIYYNGNPEDGNVWNVYQNNYGITPLSTPLNLTAGSLGYIRASADCVDLWPVGFGQFDVSESNLNVPGLEVNLVIWVETVDGAGSPIIGAGRYFDDGSAVGIQGNDNDGQDSSSYMLEFEGSKFEVRNTRIIPDSPEVGDKITLEVELVNSGIPGIADLEIKSVTNNQPPIFEGYITSQIIGKDQAQWVSIELEAFTDATTGMYYIVYDNETKEVLFNGKDQGKTFNVKFGSSSDGGISTSLILMILIAVIGVLAVVVVVIIRRNRDDMDDEFEYDYEDDKSYASIPEQTQTYSAPAAAVSPEMAEAMEKFNFWTQEEIQGYFDQGWSVQQLEEWLENQ